MNLKDFDSKPTSKLQKINRYLKEQFGFTVRENVPLKTLHEKRLAIVNQNKKIKLADQMIHKNSEIAKNLLIIEGLNQMIESKSKKKKTISEKANGKVTNMSNKQLAQNYKRLEKDNPTANEVRYKISVGKELKDRGYGLKDVAAMTESKNIVHMKKLLEASFERAEVVLAAKSLSDEAMEIVEDVGRIQNEDLMSISDAMRGVFGPSLSQTFLSNVDAALQNLIDVARQTKFTIDNEVNKLVGEEPLVDMDQAEEPVDLEGPPEAEPEVSPEDEIEPSPIEEPLGRVRKESIAKQIREAQSNIRKLKKRISKK